MLGFPVRRSVSYPVVEDQREEKAAKGIREKGETVCLFQSGTEDVRKAIAIGDVLIVHREDGNGKHAEVGKIKVLSYVGEELYQRRGPGRQSADRRCREKRSCSRVSSFSSGERCK